MKNYHLLQSELDALKEAHRQLHGKRFADQLNNHQQKAGGFV